MSTPTSSRTYEPTVVERRWQNIWRDTNAFLTPSGGAHYTFVYACTPFTTGNAHLGHVRSYTLADVCARRARFEGKSVLWAMGFDAFGLPNEMAAIEHAVPPHLWVEDCCKRMTEQFTRMGLSVDWTRCFVTSRPDYYRWTQWVFLALLKRGLVYRGEGIENWCSKCETVLASQQVTHNTCWRCNTPVSLAYVDQWYFRLLPYAEELERGLSRLIGWDDSAITCQRDLLGKTVGVEFDIPFPHKPPITIFTSFPDDIARGAFIALSPNHPYVDQLLINNDAGCDIALQRRRHLSRHERTTTTIPYIVTRLQLHIPGVARPLPVVITPIVDFRFGGGAVLGVPQRDSEDAKLARHIAIGESADANDTPEVSPRPAHRYKLRDNSVSRKRFWGAPVPVIHCTKCGYVPVPDKDLPVLLPEEFVHDGKGSPLSQHPTFIECACPTCGGTAHRDTDTLDVHFDSIWMLIPFCVPSTERSHSMFTHADLGRWLPVAQVVCGVDQAGWWLNDRFLFKVLNDAGYLSHLQDREPVKNLLMHEMVLAEGTKMSKSLGNAVDPHDAIQRYGADTVRLAVLRVNPRKAFNWDNASLLEYHARLTRVWNFVLDVITRASPSTTGASRPDSDNRRLARCRLAATAKVNAAYARMAYHTVLRELTTFFDAIQRFAKTREPLESANSHDIAEILDAVTEFLKQLEPLAPHIASELLHRIATHDKQAREALPALVVN
jgi:leucyl-tRNA synthetase